MLVRGCGTRRRRDCHRTVSTYSKLTPKAAINAGVAVIYQNLSLIPSLTVTENVFLGDELTRWSLVRRREQRKRVASLLSTLFGSVEIDPDAPVGSLPLATRQLVEVAKALHRARVKLLILDEPTVALTETETQLLSITCAISVVRAFTSFT